ncbi:MAG: cadherin-like beta sandwich domain-containing protein [Prevotellaceae bacterium]|nr:cadherin-like beta sandwich domain-containing protein [Prevotellaceae bacterium]
MKNIIFIVIMTFALAYAAMAQSNNANLGSLTLHYGELIPAFNENTTEYIVNIPYIKRSIGGDGYAASNNATVSVGGLYNFDYNYSFRFVGNDLQVGDNIFTFTVTAEDRETQKIYTLVVNRATLVLENDIEVTSNSALLVWQYQPNVYGYKLLVYADEAHMELIYTIEFNSAGDLLTATPQSAKIKTASTDINYIVEGLQSGTTYYYTLKVLNTSSIVLADQSGSFTTASEIPTEVSGVSYTPGVMGYYGILGQKLLQEPQSGVYIIKYDNGKTEKVVK